MSVTEIEQVGTYRLASAKRRIHSFLLEIDRLRSSGFPHSDGRQALDEIRNKFEALNKDLDLVDISKTEDTNGAISQISVELSFYTPILGFILRSTNLRNTFELHYSLKSLVKKLIGDDARLILSSEWDWSPFTYSISLDGLRNYVFIAGPAPEASNVLISPLAGHEIGHAVWKFFGFGRRVQSELSDIIFDIIDHAPELYKKLPILSIGDLG